MEKWPILDKNHGLTVLKKNFNFSPFQTSCFYCLKRHFSQENIIKHIFLPQIAQKKKDKKIANFRPKPWINLFGKNSIFRLSQHLVFIAQKALLSLQNTIKHIFLAYIPLKKEDGKMANFGPKLWTNPFGKNLIFRLSQNLAFIAQKGLLQLQNTIKHIFLAYFALKKEDGKLANFGPKPWTNPFEKKLNFSPFSTSFFYCPKRHFSLENIIKHIFLAQIAQKKEDKKNG